jgi:hypothetical protein
MRIKLMAILLLAAATAIAQGRPASAGGGRPGGMGSTPTGANSPGNVGRPGDVGGRPANTGQPSDVGRPEQPQQPLKDAQLNSGAFQMLEQKTGMSSDQLKDLYASSGAKNFGEFVSAVVVSKNLSLDTNQVLQGLKTKNLGQTLQDLGVAPDKAKEEIKRAKHELKQSNKGS